MSSSTSEGLSARCPTCDKLIGINPSEATGDVTCPRCRMLLWFVVVEGKARLYSHNKLSPRQKEFIAGLLASPDSLDMVELVMELEEAFGAALDTKKMSQLRSLDEWIDFIIREWPG